MPLENLSNYTEVDPNSRITPATTRVTWAGLTRNEDAYTYADKGVDYFAGNCEIQFTLRLTVADASHIIMFVTLANLIDDANGIDTANGSLLAFYLNVSEFGPINLQVMEMDSGLQYLSGVYAINLNTDYYITFKRDETVGTYGTIYGYIYSNIARTTLLETLSVALHTSTKDFRYLYACQTYNTGSTQTSSGYVEALEIVSNISNPTVTTQACTSISTTTATGNGTITNLGASSVTEHGHCWATSVNPTTANSKTTNGAGSLGTFTSSITGLTQGLTYYVRAYATNSSGTSYGGNISFKAGILSAQLIFGNIAIVQNQLHYIGEDGRQRFIEGAIAT